jgi:hypothetical protein
MMRRAALLSLGLIALAACQPTPPPVPLNAAEIPPAFVQPAPPGATAPAPEWWNGFGATELIVL